ncbi:MAG: prepilin-type N-terminal cleavage/methylation domain-containing protein [Longimicrobiales bacterium]|nr:prepilin-type N-terminal cleavage/methylation domain-containing protein [Longimicrobiales bacterium]
MNDRRGFTLIELLVVAVLGSLVVLAAYQVLITNQRAYAIQNIKVLSQQSSRGAMDVLFGELREVSAAGGDVLEIDDSELRVRVMRGLGVACNVDLGGTAPRLTVLMVAQAFQAGDSVFVFADNDDNRSADDTWLRVRVTASDSTATCGTEPAHTLDFGGQMAPFVADSVRSGAPVRAFTRFTYGLTTYNGQTFLGRREGNGDWVPLVGPLRDADTGAAGVSFEYYDRDGNTTSNVSEVRRIQVTVRTWSAFVDDQGQRVLDTLSASIYTRN